MKYYIYVAQNYFGTIYSIFVDVEERVCYNRATLPENGNRNRKEG